MKLKGIIFILGTFFCLVGTLQTQAYEYEDISERYNNNPYFATSSRYDHIYANPPRQSLAVAGRYIISTSRTRYVHSPSRLKGIRHAARINANNMSAYNY